ncbi:MULTISPECIES: SEC-C metal-binding domain-containing protein [Staphylococcaceae]|uniref:SEC-C domain-containing protein n=1 Tax=Macrococcus psychrotolerans TaxID=3039389 RepID=A0AAT9P8S2_9STAP|nr:MULTISPECIES: SEC-C metal-binding domain-containing protein [Staphylococcaceae]PKD97974.1 hypothetical protein CW719_09835 [Macrococcus caseolyticus]PKE47213.1 hypothetical protein CW677_09285 [Macrococcus caseolyticus]PKE66849.1 hypothetical protein CW663_11160 [Macrococcus caseolyticus]PKF13987.1 hypothetical protein CW690_09280 [Macrococcus caseolyticus]PKF18429.1 hypothetical protein CW717_09835 [Macrococcus caseolyticus]
MLLATWRSTNYSKYTKFNELKNIHYVTKNDYYIWCINADNLQNLITNSILTCLRYPEKLYIFESEDYLIIDKSEWYKAIRLHDVNQGLLNPLDYVVDANFTGPVEYLVKEIPKNCETYEVLPFEIECENIIMNKSYQQSLSKFKEVYQKPNYSSYEKSVKIARLNQMNFLTYVLPVIWSKKESEKIDLKNIMPLTWEQIEVLATTFIGLALCKKPDYLLEMTAGFHYWDTTEGNWDHKFHNLLVEKSINTLNKKTVKLYSDINDVKVNRNDLCPCGSGKKVKKCHIK